MHSAETGTDDPTMNPWFQSKAKILYSFIITDKASPIKKFLFKVLISHRWDWVASADSTLNQNSFIYIEIIPLLLILFFFWYIRTFYISSS